jgi:hypothetical protein
MLHGNPMRWTIRDVSVFLYGCIFASRYILCGQSHVTSNSERTNVLRLALTPSDCIGIGRLDRKLMQPGR